MSTKDPNKPPHYAPDAVLITSDDAKDPVNRRKGLRTPGWVDYKEVPKAGGEFRRFINQLIAFSGASTRGAGGVIDPPDPVITMLRTASTGATKSVHSGHSLTDAYVHTGPWPADFRNIRNKLFPDSPISDGSENDVYVVKSTVPGSPLSIRWNNAPVEETDPRYGITNFNTLMITEAGPPFRIGNKWSVADMENSLDYGWRFVENTLRNGNGGAGSEFILWSIWPQLDGWASSGNVWANMGGFRPVVEEYGNTFKYMVDYFKWKAGNINPEWVDKIWLFPGHLFMMRIYDDIELGLIPGVETLEDLFRDNIHPNEWGGYGLACFATTMLYQIDLRTIEDMYISNGNYGPPLPEGLAEYFWEISWELATSYGPCGMGGTEYLEPVFEWSDIGDPFDYSLDEDGSKLVVSDEDILELDNKVILFSEDINYGPTIPNLANRLDGSTYRFNTDQGVTVPLEIEDFYCAVSVRVDMSASAVLDIVGLRKGSASWDAPAKALMINTATKRASFNIINSARDANSINMDMPENNADFVFVEFWKIGDRMYGKSSTMDYVDDRSVDVFSGSDNSTNNLFIGYTASNLDIEISNFVLLSEKPDNITRNRIRKWMDDKTSTLT